MRIVRERKMKVRRHLRHIASKYRKVREVWNAKVEQFEKEQIEKNPQAAGSILERMAAASAAASAVGGQRRSSYRDRSSGAAGTGSSILMGGANFIRSDYEQEQLLKELMAEEAMNKRIQTGTCDKLPDQVLEPVRRHLPRYSDYCNAIVVDAEAMES